MLYRFPRQILRLLLLTTLVFAMTSLVLSQNILPGRWYGEFLGSNPEVPMYPDANANYWTFHLNTERFPNHGVRIRGQKPKARYYSFNVYDDTDFSPVASLSDKMITVDDGRYEIEVRPSEESVSSTDLIQFDRDLSRISVFLRYYLPDGGPYGGVELPEIEVFELDTGRVVSRHSNREPRYPKRFFGLSLIERFLENQVSKYFTLNQSAELHSFHLKGGGLYPNKDNEYLAMPVTPRDRVAVVRFKAPEVGGANPDVRYWSISLGDDKSLNHWTFSDQDLDAANDGFIYLLLSPEPSQQWTFPERPQQASWSGLDRAILIYRNLLTRPGYPNALADIPVTDPSDPSQQHPAHHSIGDGSPIGVWTTEKELSTIRSLSELF